MTEQLPGISLSLLPTHVLLDNYPRHVFFFSFLDLLFNSFLSNFSLHVLCSHPTPSHFSLLICLSLPFDNEFSINLWVPVSCLLTHLFQTVSRRIAFLVQTFYVKIETVLLLFHSHLEMFSLSVHKRFGDEGNL